MHLLTPQSVVKSVQICSQDLIRVFLFHQLFGELILIHLQSGSQVSLGVQLTCQL